LSALSIRHPSSRSPPPMATGRAPRPIGEVCGELGAVRTHVPTLDLGSAGVVDVVVLGGHGVQVEPSRLRFQPVIVGPGTREFPSAALRGHDSSGATCTIAWNFALFCVSAVCVPATAPGAGWTTSGPRLTVASCRSLMSCRNRVRRTRLNGDVYQNNGKRPLPSMFIPPACQPQRRRRCRFPAQHAR
jgi:hypothetical protein